MKVRFATICDRCGARSEEYSSFATCRECMDDVCPNCSINKDDETGKATCHQCLEAEPDPTCPHCEPNPCRCLYENEESEMEIEV